MKTYSVFLIIVTFLGIIFRFYAIFSQTPFFGDQAWFYMSARDALLTGHFPLLGITSSITWLHQGPLFTYLLIPGLVFSGFNPFSGVILITFLSVTNIILLSYLGSLLFSRKVGILSAFILAVSPLVVVNSRVSYHTSVIPLFMTILGLLLIKKKSFLSGLFTGLLYSLHLLTFIFWLPIFLVTVRKKYSKWQMLTGFITGIVNFIISGPIAVGGIFIWLIYKLFTGFPATNNLSFYFDLLVKFFSPGIISLPDNIHPGSGSQAYFILLFIPLSLVFGWLLSRLRSYLLIPFLITLTISNGLYLFHTRYFLNTDTYNFSLSDRINVSKKIISTSNTADPDISVVGPGSEFESTSLTYKYLTWWLGRNQPLTGQNHKFVVDESILQLRVLE